jgi:hypothetical protein
LQSKIKRLQGKLEDAAKDSSLSKSLGQITSFRPISRAMKPGALNIKHSIEDKENVGSLGTTPSV